MWARALSELGVELIPAHSPQAKGRVERRFQTFQDRLIKEMRLADVSTLEAANRFLEDYLPIYNQRFSVQPAQPADLHRPRPASRELDGSLCIKTTRCLRRDWTVAHHRHLYQVPDQCPGDPCAGGGTGGWDDTDDPPRSTARLSCDHGATREGRCGETGPPRSAASHPEAGPSVAHTRAARRTSHAAAAGT